MFHFVVLVRAFINGNEVRERKDFRFSSLDAAQSIRSFWSRQGFNCSPIIRK